MKSKDLQIGNYIAVLGIPKMVDAEMLLRLSQIEERQKIAVDLSYLELSDDVFYELGFYRYPWGFVKYDILIKTYKTNGGKKSHYCLEVGNGARIELKYVHQLQNLFRLMGYELVFIK